MKITETDWMNKSTCGTYFRQPVFENDSAFIHLADLFDDFDIPETANAICISFYDKPGTDRICASIVTLSHKAPQRSNVIFHHSENKKELVSHFGMRLKGDALKSLEKHCSEDVYFKVWYK